MKNEYRIQVNGLDTLDVVRRILSEEDIPFQINAGAGGPVICINGKDKVHVNKALSEWRAALNKIPHPLCY